MGRGWSEERSGHSGDRGRRRSGRLGNVGAPSKRRAAASELRPLFEQRGDTLPGRLHGHEHFGFKDGVSQPGVRGKVSAALGEFITPRYIDHTDARARIFAKPGQLLFGRVNFS